MGGHSQGAVEHPLEIDGYHQVKVCLWHLLDQLATLDLDQLVIAQDAGVVDQHVHPAILFHHVIHPRLHRLPVGDIYVIENDFGAEFLNRGLPSFLVHVADDHPGSFFDEALRRRLANAGRPTGDEGYSVFQAHCFLS